MNTRKIETQSESLIFQAAICISFLLEVLATTEVWRSGDI